METRIYLIRHAETTGNIENRLTGKKDYKLTEKGLNTSNQLINYFQNVNIDKIYSSTSNRTYETVKKIAEKKQIRIEKKDKLCEMYFGIYDGWKWEDVNNLNPLIHMKHIETNEIMCIPEQETTKEVEERMYKAILEIAKENLGQTILICSHGVAIEAFLRKITKEPFKNKRKEYSQHNGSINIVNYDNKNNRFQVELLNDIGYLR